MCGSRRVRRQAVTVRLRNGTTVPDVVADVCLACGEQYYDPPAMDKIEAARAKARS
jgi:YgiT-type zinc finger domain-containing protein